MVVENNRKGSMERMGLSYEDIKARRPDIVYASLNAFGHDGPWAERPGWEQLAQATSGIQVRRGGRDAAPQLSALPHERLRHRTARAPTPSPSPSTSATAPARASPSTAALPSPPACSSPPTSSTTKATGATTPEGLGVRGLSALSRLYQADDGWFYLQCPSESDWANLTGLPEFAHILSDDRFRDAESRQRNDGALADVLAAIFTVGSRQGWVKSLNDAGISAIENLAVHDFHDDPNVRQAGLIVNRDHPGMGQADHLGVVARLSETPARVGRPTPVLGSQTDEILTEAGYSASEIAALKAAGAVVQTDG